MMTKQERMEASIVAEQLLCRRWKEGSVIKALKKQYSLTDGIARRVVAEVLTVWRHEVSKTREEARRNAISTLGEMTRMALKDGNINAAVKVERLRAEIEGTLVEADGPQIPLPGDGDDEFEGRSKADLQYYAQNGCYPEDEPHTTVQ